MHVLLTQTILGQTTTRPLGGTGNTAHVRLQDSWDDTEGVTKVAMLIWDSNALEWIKWDGTVNGGSGGPDTNVNIDKFGGTSVSLGQAAMVASIPVVIASNQSAISISGTITANAGTNLNTSLLALEAGGNLAAAAASLSVLDDWDESDRAKVNPIAGQAGVQGNTGVVTALTQRVVLATDVALPTGSNTIGKIDQGTGGASAWKVDGSAVTQPVSGTVTANQGGSWTVAATQSGSWTVTANAGTNLNTSLLALDASVNGILLAQASTTSGQTGPLIQGAVTTAAPSYTTAKTSPLSLNTSGGLRVDGSGVTQPISGTVTANAGTNLNTSLLALESGGNLATLAGGVTSSVYQSNVKQINGVTVLMGNGVTGTGSQRVTIASDNTPFPIKIDQTTPGTTNAISIAQLGANTVSTGNGVSGTGVLRVAIASDNTAFSVNATIAAISTSTATTSSVSGSATSVQLLASTAGRKNATFFNDSTSVAYLKCGTTASSTDYTTQMPPLSFFSLDLPIYTGRIDAIWVTANGAMRITEFT